MDEVLKGKVGEAKATERLTPPWQDLVKDMWENYFPHCRYVTPLLYDASKERYLYECEDSDDENYEEKASVVPQSNSIVGDEDGSPEGILLF